LSNFCFVFVYPFLLEKFKAISVKENVKEKTLEDLKDKKVLLLPELNDVDIFEDIEHHPAFQHFLN
jgi:glycosyltransferase A (GT-A) superfamily protein (DUF2064 family)